MIKQLSYIVFFITLCFAADAQETYRSIRVENGGTIEGKVKFIGTHIPSTILPMTKDGEHCGATKTGPRLSIGDNNGVKNAIVYIRNIREGKTFDKTETPVLDQRACDFDPRVMVVPIGSELIITNSDPVLHNVHAYTPGENRRTLFNIAQPVRGQRTTMRRDHFKNPGLIAATCDAGHPWMNAYIMVAPHPYYAVTDKNGRFTLDNIPSGEYELVMWHEGIHIEDKQVSRDVVQRYSFEDPYEIVQQVQIAPNQKKEVIFQFDVR